MSVEARRLEQAVGVRGSADESNQAEPHEVQFYESDESLANAAGDFLAAGYHAGENPSSSRRWSTARSSRVLSRLDASTSRPPNGRGDSSRSTPRRRSRPFRSTADPIAITFGARSWGIWRAWKLPPKPVRLFGAMVDLLWRRGQLDGALAVEAFWAELQKTQQVKLLCAYVMAKFYRQPHSTRGLGGATMQDAAEGAGRCPAPLDPGELAREIAQREMVERALRQSLRTLHEKESELARLTRTAVGFAEAVTREQVFDAAVGEVAAAVGASSAGLWLIGSQRTARLVRSDGYADAVRAAITTLALDQRPRMPITDAIAERAPATILPRLFEPITGIERQVHKSRGLGIGLFITREIVQGHGGRIEVVSNEAEGTTFTVTLPRLL